MKKRFVTLLALLGGAPLLQCGETAVVSSSESHFLQRCDDDQQCGDLSCVCGVCSLPCDDDDQCSDFGGASACREPESCEGSAAVEALCVAECEDDADCIAIDADLVCEAGLCVAENPNDGILGCFARLGDSPVLLEDEAGEPLVPPVALTEQGALGVSRAPDSMGYQVQEFDSQGAPIGPPKTLWSEVDAGMEERVAVSSGVFALVDVFLEGEQQRLVCRLALGELDSLDSVLEPTRVSDEPTDTVLGEASWCDVAATSGGFVVVWTQGSSDTTVETTLFAQRYDTSGEAQGDRLTLAVVEKLETEQIALASDGTTAVLVTGSDEGARAVFFESETERTVALDDVGADVLAVAALLDRGLLVFEQLSQSLMLFDREGQLLAGPSEGEFLFGPLSDSYVVVQKDEFLVARTIDSELRQRSEPSGLSVDRGANAERLLFTPDGERVMLLYREDGRRYFAPLECADEPAGLGPEPCAERDEVTPLDTGCSEPVCHVVLRLDAVTLGVRGYQALGGALAPVDAAEALAVAQEVFDEQEDLFSQDATLSGPAAGLFTAFVEPNDFGGFALVGERSGLVVAAGGVVWDGRGYYWQPGEWRPAKDLACGEEAFEPIETSSSSADDCDGLAPASDALDVALRSNLAAHLAEDGEFSAFTYLYTPGVGVCSPEVAEYLVVLTQSEE